jgi:hypothetical protein
MEPRCRADRRSRADNRRVKLRVECYAGCRANERPIGFQLGERDYIVEEVVDQWYGPADTFFKVRADDGYLYILRHSSSPDADCWTLESFRGLKD